MSKRVIKIAAIAVGAILAVGLFALLVGPFLIPVAPLEGLATAQQVASAESRFLTVPFTGTDGIDIHYLDGGPDGADTGANAGDDAPTFVLLNGSLFNAFTWSDRELVISRKTTSSPLSPKTLWAARADSSDIWRSPETPPPRTPILIFFSLSSNISTMSSE